MFLYMFLFIYFYLFIFLSVFSGQMHFSLLEIKLAV